MTNELFAIGEIVVWTRCYSKPALIGEETTILSGLEYKNLSHSGLAWAYKTSHVDEHGVHFYAMPAQIRKKKPPREDLKVVRWDQCPWQPETVNG